MKIRKTKRGACRTCNREISQRIYGEIGSIYDISPEARRERLEQMKRRELELNKEIRSSKKLYALEGDTSSGSGIEIICERHLIEFSYNLNKLIKGLRAEEF